MSQNDPKRTLALIGYEISGPPQAGSDLGASWKLSIPRPYFTKRVTTFLVHLHRETQRQCQLRLLKETSRSKESRRDAGFTGYLLANQSAALIGQAEELRAMATKAAADMTGLFDAHVPSSIHDMRKAS